MTLTYTCGPAEVAALLAPFVREGVTFEADYNEHRNELTVTFTGGF